VTENIAENLFTIQLVQEIEKHLCLYDYTQKSYFNERTKTSAWADVSNAVKKSGRYR